MVDKYIAWDPTNKRNKQVAAQVSSAGAGDAGKIVALDGTGKLDTTLLPSGIGAATFAATAFEALTAGQFVNLFDDAGTISVRLADASNGRKADGFVLANVLITATATVYYGDVDNQLTGLIKGGEYFLSGTTPGGVVTTAPMTSTHIVQRLGKARSATELVVDIQEVPMELA